MEGPPIQENKTIYAEKMEISFESESDLKGLENQLADVFGAEGAEQLIFVLRSMSGMDFTNQCREATRELAERLNTQFGGEESFFEIVPSASFSDVRSYAPLNRTSYRGDYHSVGVIIKHSPKKGNCSIVIDSTYGAVSGKSGRKNILIIKSPGEMSQVLDRLREHYGGSWKEELRFNKQKGKLISLEK